MMNKHLVLPNDASVLLKFNKDAPWIAAANGNVLQLSPVDNAGTEAGNYVPAGHQAKVVGRHVLLEITEVGTCDTLIAQLSRVREHIARNTQAAKKAHIEELARTLQQAQSEYNKAYGIPDHGVNHGDAAAAQQLADTISNLLGAPVAAAVTEVATQPRFPEDMVNLARQLNQALDAKA